MNFKFSSFFPSFLTFFFPHILFLASYCLNYFQIINASAELVPCGILKNFSIMKNDFDWVLGFLIRAGAEMGFRNIGIFYKKKKPKIPQVPSSAHQ